MKISFSKKFISILFVFCVIFSLAYPFSQAHAQTGVFTQIGQTLNLGNLLGKGTSAVGNYVLSPFLALFDFIGIKASKAFLKFSIDAFDTVTQAVAKSGSYTSPDNNAVIGIGWKLLRDLVNIFFILGLAYIGLMTALNKGGFKTSETFGKLILVALLINFSPVICGIVVDISNLLMSFFLPHGAGSSYAGSLLTAFDRISNDINIFGFDATQIVKSIIISIFGFLMGIILIVFSLYFVIRKIIIWFAVILSPLAFFCWIFDSTKSFYTKWQKQFLFWTFTGVTVAFMIYLVSIVITTGVPIL